MANRFSVVGDLFSCAGQRKRRKSNIVEDEVEEKKNTGTGTEPIVTVQSVPSTDYDSFDISSPIRSRQSQYIRDFEGPRASRYFSKPPVFPSGPPGPPPVPVHLRPRGTSLRPLTLVSNRQSTIQEEDETASLPPPPAEEVKKRRTTMSVILANFLGIDLGEEEKEEEKKLTTLKGPPPPFPYVKTYDPPPSRATRLVDTSVRPLSIVRHTSAQSSQTDLEEQLKGIVKNERPSSSSERPISIAGTIIIEKTPTVATFSRIVRRNTMGPTSSTDKPAAPLPSTITPPPRAMIAGADDDEERRRRVLKAMREKRELEIKLVNIEKNLKKNEMVREEMVKAEGEDEPAIVRSLSDGAAKPAGKALPSSPKARRNSIGTAIAVAKEVFPPPQQANTQPISRSATTTTTKTETDATSLTQPSLTTSATTLDDTDLLTPTPNDPTTLPPDLLTDRSRMEPVLLALSKGYRVKDWVIKQSTNYRLKSKSKTNLTEISAPEPMAVMPTTTTTAELEDDDDLIFSPSPLSSPSIISASELFTQTEFDFVFPNRPAPQPTTTTQPSSELRISMIRPTDSLPFLSTRPTDSLLFGPFSEGVPGDRASIATTANFFSESTWEPFLMAKDSEAAMRFLRMRAEVGRRVAVAI